MGVAKINEFCPEGMMSNAVGVKRSSGEEKPGDGDVKKSKLEEDQQVQDPGRKN